MQSGWRSASQDEDVAGVCLCLRSGPQMLPPQVDLPCSAGALQDCDQAAQTSSKYLTQRSTQAHQPALESSLKATSNAKAIGCLKTQPRSHNPRGGCDTSRGMWRFWSGRSNIHGKAARGFGPALDPNPHIHPYSWMSTCLA